METTKYTKRGFAYQEFKDSKGVECSIQISSAFGDESFIWFGADNIDLHQLIPGKGWVSIPTPASDHVANTRMHLSQSQVKELLPILQHFADTGELPSYSEDRLQNPTHS